MYTFVINTKNYIEISGRKLDALAAYIERKYQKKAKLRILLAVPAFDLRYLHAKYPNLDLLTQHLDAGSVGSSTGALVPEIAKISGARGSIINHSERRIEPRLIEQIVERLRDLKMLSIVCAKDPEEVSRFAVFNPDFVAVEPPELIGTGRAVSSVSPSVISESRKVLDQLSGEHLKTRLLCGAGIAEGKDASRSIELGAEGILVASGVVLSRNWEGKIEELSKSMLAATRQVAA